MAGGSRRVRKAGLEREGEQDRKERRRGGRGCKLVGRVGGRSSYVLGRELMRAKGAVAMLSYRMIGLGMRRCCCCVGCSGTEGVVGTKYN